MAFVSLDGGTFNTTIPDPTVESSRVDGKTAPIDQDRWDKEYPYEFFVGTEDEANSNIVNRSDFLTGFTSPNIILNIAPSSISVNIPFANSVVATNRGILEEHNGVVFRMISISGTTGIAPVKESGRPPSPTGAIAAANAIFPGATSAVENLFKSGSKLIGGSPIDTSTVDPSTTGYYNFWRLNNFLIEYAEAKKSSENQSLRLVFSAPKDNIAYICTPVGFDLKRDASNPLLYRYNITLKAWGLTSDQAAIPIVTDEVTRDNILSVKSLLNKIREARQTIQAASNIIRGVQTDINDILQLFNQGVLALKDVAGLSLQMADLPFTIASNAELLASSNAAQWRQIVSNSILIAKINELTKNASSSFSELQQQYGSGQDPQALTDKSATTTAVKGSKTGKTTTSTNTSLGGTSVSTFNLVNGKISANRTSPTGETPTHSASSTGSLATAAKVVTLLATTPSIADQINLSSLGTVPKVVQTQIDNEKAKGAALTSGDINRLVNKLQEISDNVAYSSGLMDASYAKTYGLPAPSTPPRAPTEDDILLTAQVELAKSSFLESLASGTLFRELPDNPFLGANKIIPAEDKLISPTSAYAIIVNRGDTLEQIALTYLKNAKRARDIAVLNNLRSPYIDEEGFDLEITLASGRTFLVKDRSQLTIGQIVKLNGSGLPIARRKILDIQEISSASFKVTVDGNADLDIYTASTMPFLHTRLPGTVGSGDTLLIPSGSPADIVDHTRPTSLSDRLTFAEKLFRVDIALQPNGDLDIGPNGDLGRSYGYQNAVQALRLIIETEKGELHLHPSYGLNAKTGDKLSTSLVNEIKTRIRSAVVSDARFSDAAVTIVRTGTELNVRVDATGKQGSGRIPIEFKITL